MKKQLIHPVVPIPIAAFNQRKAIAERIQKQCSLISTNFTDVYYPFLSPEKHFSRNIYKSDKKI